MKDKLNNPFVIIGDIPEPYFCDRNKETEQIIRSVTNEGSIVLMSPRRMGKSRLVKHVFKQQRIKEHYQTFYVDLLHTSSIKEFAYTFGKVVFDQLNLQPLQFDVYYEFAQSWMQHYNKTLDLEAFKYYYDKLDGTTYYLQKLLHEAFIDCNSGEVCDRELLDRTLGLMLEEAQENISKLLGMLTEQQKCALYAIAIEGRAEKVLGAAFIRKHAISSTSSMQSALKKLIEMEILTVNGNTYCVSDVMMRLCIINR